MGTLPIVPAVKKSENLGERNGSKRGRAPGGGEKKNVGKEKGGGRGRRKKEKKKVLATEEEGSQRRRRTSMALEKIRSGTETPCVARAWGHCARTCIHVYREPFRSSVTLGKAWSERGG